MATRIRIIATFFSYLIGYIFAVYFGQIYDWSVSGSMGGSFLITPGAALWIAGMPLAIVFFQIFFMQIVGGYHRWKWTIFPLVPIIVFEIAFDSLHIYIPIIIGLIAWGLGTMAHKALTKLVPSFMAKIS